MKPNPLLTHYACFLIAASATLASVAPISAREKSSFPVKWELAADIKAPESAYLDKDSGFLFLSQIRDGGGMKKDGDGVVSKLTPDGKMIEKRWVTGLNAPKGLRSHQGTLWISDIDTIIAVDIESGKVKEKKIVEGAKFLNDLACGPDGAVYVSDMLASRIYRYKGGKLSVFAEGDDLECPNGLLVVGNRLLVGGWGIGINPADFSTKTAGRFFSLDLKTKEKTIITRKPVGHLDGVELDGKGGYLVSDWIAGKVFHISAEGAVKLILQLPKGAADHAYVVEKNLLILPRMLENKVTAYDLSALAE